MDPLTTSIICVRARTNVTSKELLKCFVGRTATLYFSRSKLCSSPSLHTPTIQQYLHKSRLVGKVIQSVPYHVRLSPSFNVKINPL